MESATAFYDFLSANSSYMFAFALASMILFSGVFVFVNVCADLGFYLYHFFKNSFLVLWRKVKK